MNDDDDAMTQYARAVGELLRLYRRVHVQLDRCAMGDLMHQLVLVEALTAVATLPIIRAIPEVPS